MFEGSLLSHKQMWRKCSLNNNKLNLIKDENIPYKNKSNTHESNLKNEIVIKIEGTIIHKKVSFYNNVNGFLIPTKEEYNWMSLYIKNHHLNQIHYHLLFLLLMHIQKHVFQKSWFLIQQILIP